jgi:hypothetical protein
MATVVIFGLLKTGREHQPFLAACCNIAETEV